MNSVNQLLALLPEGGWQRLLCDALWQSALIAALGCLIARFLARHAAARAWVLLLTATACIIVPLASAASRDAGWTLLARVETAAIGEEGENGRKGEGKMIVEKRPMSLSPAMEVAPIEPQQSLTPPQAAEPESTATTSAAPILPFPPSPILSPTPSPLPPPSVSPIHKLNWMYTLGLAWLIASALLALRLAFSALAVRKILRHSKPCDDARLLSAATEAAARVGLRDAPPVLVSNRIESPMVLALTKPCLLVPHGREENVAEVNWTAAFTHELAHVARRDGWSRLWMELVAIALPLQPLVWLVRRNFHLACEEACDDWSVAAGSDPVDLAETLTTWLGRRMPKPATAIGMSSTKARVLRLLAMREKPPAKVPRAWRWISVPSLLLVIAGLAVAQVPTKPRQLPTDPPPDARATSKDRKSEADDEVKDEQQLIDTELDNHPSIAELNKQISDSYNSLGSASSSAKTPARDGAVRKLQRQIADLEQQFEQIREKLRPKLLENLRTKRNKTFAQNRVPPSEKAMISLPPYTIEPPDVLLIDLINAVPKEPMRIAPFDKVQLEVAGTAVGHDIKGTFQVDSTGELVLGPIYGSVNVKGLTRRQAQAAIDKHLCETLKDPEVSLTIDESRLTKGIAGEHLVAPDGTVNFGTFGSVNVRGMTVPEASTAVEKKLAEHFESIKVAVDVFAYNSKVYYVIAQGGDGNPAESVQRFPATGNETVLDAISQVQGLSRMSSKNIWISRPAGDGKPDQILRVRWDEIVAGGGTCTNYQVLPGDRVFVGASTKSAEFEWQLVSDQVWPTELGPYVIEPPDLVLIDALRIVPKQPFVIQPLDVLSLEVSNVAAADQIRGLYLVEPGGQLNLGPKIGKVKVGGLSLKEATAALTKHLAGILKEAKVSLTLNEPGAQSQINGEHLVGPDGTVNFGTQGMVYIAGMTITAAKEAIENHLSQHFEEPIVSIDVQSKSKVYYVILSLNNGRGGDNILWFPATGNDTVLDAIAKIGGLRGVGRLKVWIERPSPDPDAQIKIDITPERLLQRGRDADPRLLPGDRLVIQGESIRRMPNEKLPPNVEKYSVELKFRTKQPKRNYDETYELQWAENTTVLDAIKELGTPAEFAGAKIYVVRGSEQLPVNLPEIERGEATTNHKLQADDRLVIDGIDTKPPDPNGRFPKGFQTF